MKFVERRCNTPEQIRSLARDHVSYRWAHHPCDHWDDEQHAIYRDEYTRYRDSFSDADYLHYFGRPNLASMTDRPHLAIHQR
jgi:hypothetical protein